MNEVKEWLNRFNYYQQNRQCAQFAWMCGLRALPFLSTKRGFVYWPKEEQQKKHLNAIFNALDCCKSRWECLKNRPLNDGESVCIYEAMNNVSEAVKALIDDTPREVRVALNSVDYAIQAHLSPSFAVEAAYKVDLAYAWAFDSATDEYYVVIETSDDRASPARMSFRNTLKEDSIAINEGKPFFPIHVTGNFAELWSNFREDLVNAGCDDFVEFVNKYVRVA